MRIHWKIWDEVFEKDNGYCAYCGIDLTKDFNTWMGATADHVQHVSIGGKDDLSNLLLCCSACNTLLSRASHLTTRDTRKAYVVKRRAEFEKRYEPYKRPWTKPASTRTLGDEP